MRACSMFCSVSVPTHIYVNESFILLELLRGYRAIDEVQAAVQLGLYVLISIACDSNL